MSFKSEILKVLETLDCKCLDNEAERMEVATALAAKLRRAEPVQAPPPPPTPTKLWVVRAALGGSVDIANRGVLIPEKEEDVGPFSSRARAEDCITQMSSRRDFRRGRIIEFPAEVLESLAQDKE